MLRRMVPAAALVLLTACGSGGAGPTAAAEPVADCPPTLEDPAGAPPRVPQQPTAETTGRLVPEQPPQEALLCRYGPVPFDPPSSPGPVALAGQRALTGGLQALPQDLRLPRKLGGQSRACTLVGGPRTPYLLRLTYPDGVVWLSTVQEANGCEDAGNGSFVTAQYLGQRFAVSYDAGTWAEPRRPGPAQPCDAGPPGRAGQEGSLVPGQPEELRVCTATTDRVLSPDVLRQVRELLSDPVAEPAQGGCSRTRPGPDLLLLLSYADGPGVRVQLNPGCRPNVSNGSLQAQLSPEQEERLLELVALR